MWIPYNYKELSLKIKKYLVKKSLIKKIGSYILGKTKNYIL